MIVRKVKMEDIEHNLLNVYIEGYNYHLSGRPDIFNYQTDEMLRKDLENKINDREMIVIEEDEKIIGFIIYHVKDIHARVLWISQLVIDEEYRGRGYAKVLMDKVIKEAEEKECVRIELSCWAFNEKVYEMYKHLGFSEQSITMEKNV